MIQTRENVFSSKLSHSKFDRFCGFAEVFRKSVENSKMIFNKGKVVILYTYIMVKLNLSASTKMGIIKT